MPLSKSRIQQHLRNFNFRQLFSEELGWDNPPAAAAVLVDGQRYALTAIAHKRGLVAYQCPAPLGGRIPAYTVPRKIDQQATKSAHEYLIIFTDPAQTTQIWYWVKREPGRTAASKSPPPVPCSSRRPSAHSRRDQVGATLPRLPQNNDLICR